MWQRKQTIFLVIVIICMTVTIFFPLWGMNDGENSVLLYPFYLKTPEAQIYYPYALVAVLAIAAITVAVIETGKFNNRMTQIKLGALNSLLMAGCLIAAVVFIRNLEGQYPGSYGFSVFLPAVAMICNSIANRLIRRDERLVRESERLR